MGQLTNVVGAVVSLALMAGIGVWGYKLFVRDVSGVPVVRAAEEEMRIAPKDPGGQQAAHQGLAVNSVAADGVAEAPAERLVLAPRPVDLLQEDAPMPELAAKKVLEAAPSDVARVEIEQSETDVVQASLQSASIDALVAELTNGVEPLSAADPDNDVPVVTTVAAPVAKPDKIVAPEPVVKPEVPTAVLDAPGVKRSLRPRNRPEGGSTLIKAALEAPVVESLDAASIEAGTRMVQLGAFESEAIAESEWGRLKGDFSDYLDGKQRVVQRASSGGRVFYRLRAVGFDDLSDARRFCSVLVAENADCIPVVAR
ncbi:MAG: SPOR domain-containing protein [Paracoccaceae bacterium]